MTDENINPQNIPIQSPNTDLTNQKSPPSSSKKTILIVLLIILIIAISLLFFLFFNQKEKSTNPTIIPTVNPQISMATSGQLAPSSGVQITPEFVPDEVIVKYKTGQSPDEIKDENKKNKLEDSLQRIGVLSQEKLYNSDDPILKRSYLLKFKKGSDILNAIEKLNKLEEIEYAEPNNIQNTF